MHMLEHIGVMNLIAPLTGLAAWSVLRNRLPANAVVLWAAVVAQILLLYVWHAPVSMDLSSASVSVKTAGHMALLSCSTAFWYCVVALFRTMPWHVIAGLLVTGKLACFLGVIYVFSPRVLAEHHGASALVLLADQQQAGLLMLTACPLTFVGAAIVIVTWWLFWRPQSATSAAGLRTVG